MILSLIKGAKDEIQVLAYILTPQASAFIAGLERAAARGVKITLIVNDLASLDEDIKRRLLELSSAFPHVRVVDFGGATGARLHAKAVVVDRSKAVVGSANLSYGGMVANYEIGALIEGEEAWNLGELIDLLVQLRKDR